MYLIYQIIWKWYLGSALWGALRVNKLRINDYHHSFGEYPVLKDGMVDFWDLNKNQYVWRNKFQGLTNLATNPKAIEIRRNAWKVPLAEPGKYREPNDTDLEKYLNPISGKFDWLAVGEDGQVYSPKMSDTVLIASPPIRIKDIRCPLTASEPPFFEDLTRLESGL